LNNVKKEKRSEDFSLLGYNPAKNKEENNCKMTSKVSEPGEDLI
jgi:hypothetical protein